MSILIKKLIIQQFFNQQLLLSIQKSKRIIISSYEIKYQYSLDSLYFYYTPRQSRQAMEQYDEFDTFLMIASSSKRKELKKRDIRTSPLQGIGSDLNKFKRKFKNNNLHYIETSRDCKILLSKQYIINWLLYRFQTSPKDVYLFYSGHGHENGDWAVETSNLPNGDRLSFDELIQIWKLSNANDRGRLFVFLDSCHSSGWCRRLASKQESISVFASCAENQKSTDLNDGGLLARCLFSTSSHDFQNNVQLIINPMFRQTPHFINRMKRPEKLTENHIRLLFESIKNAKNIIQQEENTQEKIKLQFMKATGVQKWQMIKQKNKSSVYLIDRNLKRIPKCIGELSYLERLQLGSNKISQLPQQMSKLTKLSYLGLSSNPLGSFPSFLLNMSSLQELYLANTKIRKLPINCGEKLNNLILLDVQNNSLQRLPSLLSFKKLKQFYITIQEASTIDPLDFPIQEMKSLEFLMIENKKYTLEDKQKQFQNKCRKNKIQLLWKK